MSAQPSSARPPFRLNGWHVLGIVCAFFAVVISVDMSFAMMAVRTFPGQVSVTPYEDGLVYDRHIAQLQAQGRLGWRAAAAAEPRAVMLEFQDASGAPVRGLKIEARLERPATETGRILLRFAEAEPGRYLAPTAPLAGAWDLTAEARNARGDAFVAERRLTWP